MRPLANRARMSAAEAAAERDFGVPSRLLMENAASAVEAALPPGSGDSLALLVLAGSGNNGGDGLAVAARLAHKNKLAVKVVLSGTPRPSECAFRLDIARKAGLETLAWPDDGVAVEKAFHDADVILDALCGTGLASPLREREASLLALYDSSAAFKIALDAPTGFREGMKDGEAVFRADETLCIGMDKTMLHVPAFREFAGEIRVIGEGVFPASLLRARAGDPELIGSEDIEGLLESPSRDAHKGKRGRLAVFAGADGMSGAAYLSASAGARSGAGYVRLSTDASVLPLVARRTGGVMAEALPPGLESSVDFLKKRSAGADAVVVGPGWGRTPGRKEFLRAIIASGKPAVIDADALAFLGEGSIPPPGSIITPHPGEAAALLGITVAELLREAPSLAPVLSERFRAVAVIKGSVTWIASPDGALACLDGRLPELGTAGSGDVLAGILGALLARGMGAFEAAKAGVLIHLEAGRRAASSVGSFLAEDLLGFVSRVAKDAEGRGGHGGKGR